MVAAKSLVAAALIGLIYAAGAFGDAPTVRLTSADQAKAAAGLLRHSDLGSGWLGGQVKASALTPPDCPNFDPKESDLVVTGHADARYTFPQAGIELDQDVEVLANAADVLTDFGRTISPGLPGCIAFQLGQLDRVVDVSVARLRVPPIGSVSAVYRATLGVRSGQGESKLLTDYVFFGEGRLEYEFTVSAPIGAADQLTRFELGLAQILLHRAGASS